MVAVQKEIQAFIYELEKEIPLDFSIKKQEYATAIQLKHLFIYIYSPHTVRKENILGFQTIHIDFDQMITAQRKIIYRIKGLLGFGQKIYARQTIVARVDKRIAMEFQQEHHLQVALPGKYRYGLFLDGDLVSIAVFSGGRRMNSKPEDYRSFELLRFCHKGGSNVVGGISKLIQRFIDEFAPSDIMTYADLDWCQESSLERIGFIASEIKEVQTFWVDQDNVRYCSKPEDHIATRPVTNNGSIKLKLSI